MEQVIIFRWVLFCLISALISATLAATLIFLITRCCCKRRVDDTTDVNAMDDPFSNGPRGVDPTLIETFPKFTYTASHGKKQCRGMLVCVICLGVFKEGEMLRSMPKCGHVFHVDCVGSWLKTHDTCPCCRADLAPKSNGSGLLNLLPDGLVRLV